MAKNHRFPSAIAAEELQLPGNGPVGFLNAHMLKGLEPLSTRLVCEQGFRPEHDRLQDAGFSTAPVIDGRYSAILVLLGKHRQLNRANIARALKMLEPSGVLILDGQKTAGINPILSEVKKFTPLAGSISRDHGKLAWTAPLDAGTVAPDGWLEAARLSLNEDGHLTSPGMFSAKKADPGSRRLAQHFNAAINGHIADLGAGWGWLSAACLKTAAKVTVCDLYEADHASLEAARKNVTDPRAAFHWQDIAALQMSGPGYNFVLCNPPFHHARTADPDLGAAFITAAARILKPSGTALFVANRQLPYESVFSAQFADWSVLAQDRHFKVIRARRPRGLVAAKRFRKRIR